MASQGSKQDSAPIPPSPRPPPNPTPAHGLRVGLIGAFPVVVLIVAQQYGNIPGDTLLVGIVQNVLHIPWFAALVLVIWHLAGRRHPLFVLAVCAVIAVGSEALQLMTQRDASPVDLGLDLLGAAIATLGIVLHRHWNERRQGPLAAWSTAALVLTLATLAAPFYLYLGQQARADQFPRLLAVDSGLQRPWWSANGPTRVIPAPEAWARYAGKPVLQLDWADHPYPGIELREVIPDWRCCTFLVVELFIAGDEPMLISTAVGHPGIRGTARYSPHQLPPGPNRLEVPLERLGAIGPQANAITKLIIHTSRDYAGRSVLIGDIRLE